MIMIISLSTSSAMLLAHQGHLPTPNLVKKKERNHLMCTICGYVDLNCVEISRIHLVSFVDL